MKLLLSTNHRIYATDVPESVEPLIKQWFGAKRTDNGWQVPRRLVWAFINYYPGVEVSPSLQAWLTNHYSRNEVLGRVRKHLHRYRGGYQAKIVAHAIDRRSHGIFTGFGSGKTMILLEIARQVGPTLLVVPPLIWQNAYVDQSKDVKGRPHGDLLRWYRDLRWVASMSTRDREQRIASFSARADIYAVSPGLVGSMRHVLSQIPLAAIMVDESAVMRNQNAAITKTLLELAPSVTFRVLATAEPAPDNLGELYTQVRFLDPHRLGTRAEFDAQYGQRGQWGVVYRDRQKSVAALNEINHDGLVTVLTETEFWPDAPPLDVVKVPVRLGKSQSRAYKARRDNLSIRIGDDEITSSNTIRQVMDLRQLTAGFLYDRGKAKQVCEYPAKLKYVEKLLRLPPPHGCKGEQCIIWCHFRYEYELLERLMSALGISHGTLRGRDKHSMDALRRFLKRKIRVLITHQQVAGHGLRFPQCRHAIYYSVDWSNDRFQQSLRRFWRPPQKRSCRVWLLMAENTVDHDIVSALEGKANWRDICRRTLRSHNRSVPSNGTGPGSERKRPPIPTHRAPATTPRVRGV